MMKVEPKESSHNTMCQGLLLALERALDDFFESLKQDYDAAEQRMVFVSVFSQSFLQVRFFCF